MAETGNPDPQSYQEITLKRVGAPTPTEAKAEGE